MNGSVKRCSIKWNKIKYMAYRVLSVMLFLFIFLYILAGLVALYGIKSSGVVGINTEVICMIVFVFILLGLGLLYEKIISSMSYSTLKVIREKSYCPVCGSSHNICIRGKAPVNKTAYQRYIYRWCERTERVVNIYTRFHKDYDDEVLQLNEVAADYDRIYACEYRKIRKKEMKKEDKEASDS